MPLSTSTRALLLVSQATGFGSNPIGIDRGASADDQAVRFERERQALPALALTTDTSVLTAVGNDLGFAQVFARQIEALGAPGDVAVGITTSGASSNVRAALDAARAHGLVTVALTGNDGGVAGSIADLHLNVPHTSTARVQEVQRTQIHAICWLVEQGL